MKNIAVFLDRDGTIIEDKHYLNDPEGLEFIEGAIPALKMLQRGGYKLIVVTNQSGIAKKMVTVEQMNAIHDKLVGVLSLNGIKIDDIHYCPHHPQDNCHCRKPNIGMALKASKKSGIDLTNSFCIGDKISDVLFAGKFGGKGILVLTGHGKNEKQEPVPDYVAKDLYDAAKWIIETGSKIPKNQNVQEANIAIVQNKPANFNNKNRNNINQSIQNNSSQNKNRKRFSKFRKFHKNPNKPANPK
ncbi:MAG: hypothetical protein A2252_00610 [Elusimicrobia bacterium RIFOXYA2_FULL_39_19]|nr:MAG: hypothetical protein A2252_00610 [Elusimicrobia bacterium RIFOXYA2_FULL_39_19]